MKIAILNPYFDSLGGGEKVTAVMAAHFSKKHEVIILVKKPVDPKVVERYFDVDLSKVSFVELSKDPFWVKLFGHHRLPLPGRWRSILYDRVSLLSLKNVNADVFINDLYQSSLPSPTNKSIYMCMFPQRLSFDEVYKNGLRRFYNQFTNYLEHVFVATRKEAIDSYTIVTANSKYTAGWIKKYWQRDAEVVYPVCDDMGPPKTKENIILNVGRFFADNGSSHHKKQHELVKAFLKLNRDDWHLYLAGSAADDYESKKYMKRLELLAGDHKNIHVETNVSFVRLRELYKKASIYWHATGLGYNANEFPENQEHFGISTVEAMSAGGVPVVIRSAGQLEVVEDAKNGLLWDNVDQLVMKTKEVIEDVPFRLKLSKAAITSAKSFARGAFEKRMDEILKELTNE